MKPFFFALLICLTLPAHADLTEPTMLSLHASTQLQHRASEITVDLVVMNPDSQPLSYPPPQQLTGTLQSGQRGWPVQLHPAQPVDTKIIGANQFVSIPYLLALPADISGNAVLEVETIKSLRVIINISDQPAAAANPDSFLASMKAEEADAPPVESQIERTFANRFALHEPIYFIDGSKTPSAKFQFSFKYRLIGHDGKFGELIPPFRGFYFAYTQRSLWDLQGNSSPFYDTSYMPELFFEWLGPERKNSAGWFHWLGTQTGFRHESNGKDGTDSRSLNNVYLRAGMAFGSLNGWHVVVAPRIFSYLAISDSNRDIAKYRGNGELQMSVGKNDSSRLSVLGRLGSGGHKGSVQVDLTQPIRIPLIDLETYLQLQYFNGYGESLRSYNQKSSVWRIGLAFVR